MGRVADRALEVAGNVVKFDAAKSEMQLHKLKDYEYLVRKASAENSEAQAGEGNTHLWTALGAVSTAVLATIFKRPEYASFGSSFIKEFGNGFATYKRRDQKGPQTEESINMNKMSAINDLKARSQEATNQLQQNVRTILDAEHQSKEKSSRRQ